MSMYKGSNPRTTFPSASFQAQRKGRHWWSEQSSPPTRGIRQRWIRNFTVIGSMKVLTRGELWKGFRVPQMSPRIMSFTICRTIFPMVSVIWDSKPRRAKG
ncbi:hypothetical protein M758_UG083600 [Ceratodon purpureus]|nr:hypothetical protein M758_UG083600 [Ceratodon purpureus]